MMLPELVEADARGDAARIYGEIRHFCAVPYVSSLQRHLATRPGWLEWTWTAIRPAFASGEAQEAGWRVAADTAVPALDPIGRDVLRVWGVDEAGEAAIRAVCDSFVRVSPTNLMYSGLVRALLAGERPDGPERAAAWEPPAPTPPLPPLVDTGSLPEAEHGALMRFATDVGGVPFVPGLYRMLAGWPAFLAHLATVLAPHLHAPVARTACAGLLERVDAALPTVLAGLPPLPAEPPMPPAGEFDAVLSAIESYRRTSPEMVVFGRMIRESLPAGG